MSGLDLVFPPLATQLIDNNFGTAATLRRETKTYDVTTGKNTVSTSNNAVKISPPAPYAVNRINDSTVQAGDFWCFLGAQRAPFVPTTDDKLVFGGEVWQLVRVEQLISGDQTAAYRLQLRK